jgi:predicted transcriptional regulator
MSKRLQVVMSDEEYRAVERVARKWEQPVSEVVRASLKRTVEEAHERAPEERIAAVLRFARFDGPTGDIDSLLADIEAGRASREPETDGAAVARRGGRKGAR